MPSRSLHMCAKHSPQEDVEGYLVDDGEKAIRVGILNVSAIIFLWRTATVAFFQELGTHPWDRHQWWGLVGVVMMVFQPSCRMPPAMLLSPLDFSLFNL